jgi:hypothetical protein
MVYHKKREATSHKYKIKTIGHYDKGNKLLVNVQSIMEYHKKGSNSSFMFNQ